jgi:hypothetical protein
MMTLWMHNGDPLWPLFLARIIVLVAAIGMGVIFFGLGAIVVRCVAAAKLWFGKRARNNCGASQRQRAVNRVPSNSATRATATANVPVGVAWARPHLSDSYAPAPRHQSNPYPPPPNFRSSNPTRKHMPASFNGPAGN